MKKLLLSFLVLLPMTSLIADMRFNESTKKFSTVPESSYINQAEYHDLMYQVGQMVRQYHISGVRTCHFIKHSNLTENLFTAISTYLATKNTPTSERLLMDLVKLDIFGSSQAVINLFIHGKV